MLTKNIWGKKNVASKLHKYRLSSCHYSLSQYNIAMIYMHLGMISKLKMNLKHMGRYACVKCKYCKILYKGFI